MHASRPFGMPQLAGCTLLYLSLALAIIAQIIYLPPVPIEPPAKSFVASLGQVPVPAEAISPSPATPGFAWLHLLSLTPPVRTGIQCLRELDLPAPSLVTPSSTYPELRGVMLVADLAMNVAPRLELGELGGEQLNFQSATPATVLPSEISEPVDLALRAGAAERISSVKPTAVETIALAH